MLEAAREAMAGKTDAQVLKKLVGKTIASAPLAKIDYVETIDAKTLAPVTHIKSKTLIAAAVFFGKTRLIDNIVLKSR